MKAIQYFEIDKNRQEYCGKRFFKWTIDQYEVVQINFGGGEPRRGRCNNFGIHHITTQTFFSNYFAMGYAVPCTKSKYDKAFKEIIKALY